VIELKQEQRDVTECRQMTVEDFLKVMEMNVDIYPEFNELTDEQKRYLAFVNINTGEAVSFFRNDQFLGLGGIRYIGIGEAWILTTPEMIAKGKIHNHGNLLRESRKIFKKVSDEHHLWRVFADSSISETFLEHCGFERRPKGYCWTRTE